MGLPKEGWMLRDSWFVCSRQSLPFPAKLSTLSTRGLSASHGAASPDAVCAATLCYTGAPRP